MLKGEPIIIYGDGNQTRDFTYVQNAVSANLKACESQNSAGEVMNIACGDRISLNQLVSTMMMELAIDAEIIYTEPKPGDVMHSYADISKAKSCIDYEPLIGFEDGLSVTIKWLKNVYEMSYI